MFRKQMYKHGCYHDTAVKIYSGIRTC